MKKCLAISLMFAFLVIAPAVPAEQQEIITEGEYSMGTGETMAVAEERALREAQRKAAEQAGIFIKSYSHMKNLALTEDVVEVIANHSMKVTVLDRKKTVVGDLDAIRFVVRIKAVVKTEEVEANLRKIREDSRVVESYKKLKAEYDRQAKEIEALKKQLTEGADKKQVLAKITEEEKKFKANLWLEKGSDYTLSPELAMKAYNTALDLNPDLAMAYVGKAGLNTKIVQACYDRMEKEKSDCRKEIADLYQALADVNRAISMDVNYADAYALRAEINDNIRSLEWVVAYKKDPTALKLPDNRKNQKAIMEDIDRAIALGPDSHRFYERRAKYLDAVNDSEKQIADMTSAIELCRKANCDLLFSYYGERSRFYENAGNLELAREDERISNQLFKSTPAYRIAETGTSEFNKLGEYIYLASAEDKKAKALEDAKKAIAAGRADANDYWARAMLGDGDDSSRIMDIADAIRLLERKNPRDRDALKLAYMYDTRAKMLKMNKKYEAALKDLTAALAVIDRYLPQALCYFEYQDLDRLDDGKIYKLSRLEAEAVIWMFLKTSALREQAEVYEELNFPAKALVDYEMLCKQCKQAKACKDVDRLK